MPRDGMLPARAGIGSNDPDEYQRAAKGEQEAESASPPDETKKRPAKRRKARVKRGGKYG